MTAAEFAVVMDQAYDTMRPWSEQELAGTLELSTTLFLTRKNAGLVAQALVGDIEILALATAPTVQHSGLASELMKELFTVATRSGASRVLLDVAKQNAPARAFYQKHGFVEIGRRARYYTLRDGSKDDALVLSRSLN